MKPTPRHYLILEFIALVYAATRATIQEELFPETGKDGAVVRKLLGELFHIGWINKTRGEVVFPDKHGAPPPVYYPSAKGLEALASHTGDVKWLDICCRAPQWQMLLHYVYVSLFGLRLRKAAAASNGLVGIESWMGEWDEKNPKAKEPEEKYKLFTLVRKIPRLVANPDAGWEIMVEPHRKAAFLEFDRNTTGARAISVSKPPGYAGMVEQDLHKRIFPKATVAEFSVLSVSLTPNRRDLLRKLFVGKPGAKLWKFVSWTDWTPDKILFEPIIYDCEKGPFPLIRKLTGGEK